ncbi:MAG: RimK family alpha-L-glutamate ligase [Phycisphaerales bacterium]
MSASPASCRVALACCEETPAGAPDDAPLAAALARAGASVTHTRWDDGAVDWASFDVVVIRSTWDYHLRADDFLAWGERVSGVTNLANPRALVRWNADKRYLVDLEDAGVAITPTVVVEADGGDSIEGIVGARGWDRFVVKPTVSATAFGTERFASSDTDRAARHLAALLERGPALVQRYEPAIERDGERSVMVIGGHVTHCVVKRPKFGDFRCQSDFGGTVEATALRDADVDLALRAVAAAPVAPRYARVDVIDTPDGVRLMELECIEPELFFRLSEDAVARMVDALTRSPERELGDTRTLTQQSDD